MSSLPTVGFVRLEEILKHIPIGRSSWLIGVKSGRYPKPIRLSSNAVAWRAEDIHSLIKTLGETEYSPDSTRGNRFKEKGE